ncbi:hypothetical protein KKHLCK_16795 [Candidatus Electrothrix laxa]
MGPEDHDQNKDQGDDDPLEEFQGAEGFTEHRDADRADNGADNGVESAEIHHSQHFSQSPDTKTARTYKAVNMSIQAPCHPGPEGPEHEGGHLGFTGVDGHGVGSSFVIAHCIEGLAHNRGGEIMDDPDAEDGPDKDHR